MFWPRKQKLTLKMKAYTYRVTLPGHDNFLLLGFILHLYR